MPDPLDTPTLTALQIRVTRLMESPPEQFLRSSNRLFQWLLQQEEYAPILQDINQEFTERIQHFQQVQQAHMEELKALFQDMSELFPELGEEAKQDLPVTPTPSVQYLYSLKRVDDLLHGRDLWGQITSLEDAKHGDDPTPVGQAFGLLHPRVSDVYQNALNQQQGTEAMEQFFLAFCYLADRQGYVVTEFQEWLQTHVTQALKTLVFIQQALNPYPRNHPTLNDRIRHLMGTQKVHLHVQIRQEVRGERKPDLAFHQQIKQHWSMLLEDFADRLKVYARRMRGEKKPEALPTIPPAVLVLTSNPADDPLWTEEEYRKIHQELRQAPLRDTLRVLKATAVRSTHLLSELDHHQPDILHFSGHGSKDSLCFVDDQGNKEDIYNDALLRAFQQAPSVKVLVLVACDSRSLALKASRVFPVTIGMNGKLMDTAAAEFSSHLYLGISQGYSLQKAFDRAVAAVGLLSDVGYCHTMPKMYHRKDVDPGAIMLVNALIYTQNPFKSPSTLPPTGGTT